MLVTSIFSSEDDYLSSYKALADINSTELQKTTAKNSWISLYKIWKQWWKFIEIFSFFPNVFFFFFQKAFFLRIVRTHNCLVTCFVSLPCIPYIIGFWETMKM